MTPLKVATGIVANPLLMSALIAIIGLLLRRARPRGGRALMVAGALLAYLASTSWVGDALLAPLENQYPPFDVTRAPEVSDIVVLGSGFEPRDHIPVTGALDGAGLARIVEGVRLATLRPGTRLLVSGGAPPGYSAGAHGYAQLAGDLGIAGSAVVVLDHALNTAQEAHDVAAVLGHAPFILVTSAYHMPRAMRLMRRAGANPVPAPTEQLHRAGLEPFGLFPGSHGLRKTEAALHEYLGLAAILLNIG